VLDGLLIGNGFTVRKDCPRWSPNSRRRSAAASTTWSCSRSSVRDQV